MACVFCVSRIAAGSPSSDPGELVPSGPLFHQPSVAFVPLLTLGKLTHTLLVFKILDSVIYPGASTFPDETVLSFGVRSIDDYRILSGIS